MNRKSFFLASIVAVVLIIAAYANSLDNAFHFDDSHVIVTNVYLHSLHNVPLFFTDAHTFSSLPQNSTYRPLVTLTLAIDYAMGHGLAPRMFHITQIVLMLITGVLLVIFFTPITDSDSCFVLRASSSGEEPRSTKDEARRTWLPLFCATFFCIHTANTETMNLISARSELLSTIGLLATFILYQRSAFARRTLLYLIPLAIGALAKAPLVVFAPLLYAYAVYIEKQTRRDALRVSIPPLILGIFLLVFLNSMNAKEWVGGGGSQYHYVITQPFIWLHYFRLFFLPIGLTADTDMTTFAHWYDTRAIAGYAFVALLIWAIRKTKSGPVAFGLCWFAIALIPTSIFPLAEVANEHRIFFAYIGLVLAVACFVMESVPLSEDAKAAIATLLLLVHAGSTQARNRTWKTETSLWADVVDKSPGNGRAWMNYGLTQMARADYAGAKVSFDRAMTTVPNYSVLEINEGINTAALGDQAGAEAHFQRALKLNPDSNSHFFYGRWLVQHGRASEAVPHVREALRLSPALGDARALLLRLEAASASPELPALEAETLRINPDDHTLATYPNYDAALKAGNDAMQRKNWLIAARAYREALRFNAASAEAQTNLAQALRQAGL